MDTNEAALHRHLGWIEAQDRDDDDLSDTEQEIFVWLTTTTEGRSELLEAAGIDGSDPDEFEAEALAYAQEQAGWRLEVVRERCVAMAEDASERRTV